MKVIYKKPFSKVKICSLALLVSSVLGTICCKPVDSAEAKLTPKMGYKLVMKVSYFGRVEWSVSADGARLTSPMLAVVCRPPNFDTILYNTESKKMKKFSRESGFERIGMMVQGGSMGRSRYEYSPWKKVGEDTVAGRKCLKFTRHMLNAQQDAHHYAALDEEYWVAQNFDLPHIDELMAPLAKLTTQQFTAVKGFGMRRVATWRVYRRGDPVPKVNDRMVHLDTIECKKAMIDPKIFDLGTNFTPVRDEGELLFSDDGGMTGGLTGGPPGHF